MYLQMYIHSHVPRIFLYIGTHNLKFLLLEMVCSMSVFWGVAGYAYINLKFIRTLFWPDKKYVF